MICVPDFAELGSAAETRAVEASSYLKPHEAPEQAALWVVSSSQHKILPASVSVEYLWPKASLRVSGHWITVIEDGPGGSLYEHLDAEGSAGEAFAEQ